MSATTGSHGSSTKNADLYDRKDFPDEGREGRFGRMFPVGEGGTTNAGEGKLRPHPSPRYDLERLGDIEGPMSAGDRMPSKVPAGMTFLGQFIDHDITLDTQSKFEKPEINFQLENARTPNLDLDCVYGGGRDASPHLYAGPYLLEGVSSGAVSGIDRSDLVRNPSGRAVIGDPRNDENILVSQIQATFLRFHNRCVDVIGEDNSDLSDEELFEQARDTTIHYYHRVVLEDFLFHVIGASMIHDIATEGRAYYFPTGFWDAGNKIPQKPFMPIEFSVAAYRYGHSQVRDSYKLNDNFTVALFTDRDSEEPDPLRGFQPLPTGHSVDWDNFFRLPGTDPVQCAFKIDPFLPAPLLALPKFIVPEGGVASLASRNLLRGRTFRLPSGEEVARRMIADEKLLGHSEAEHGLMLQIEGSEDYSSAINGMLTTLRTDYAMTTIPLWLYILLEAAEFGKGFIAGDDGSGGGDRLGPLGGRLVGEVLMGLLDHYRDMSGKGLDYAPKVRYRTSDDTDQPDRVLIKTTPAYGPRMSMRAFVDFAYAKNLKDTSRVRGGE